MRKYQIESAALIAGRRNQDLKGSDIRRAEAAHKAGLIDLNLDRHCTADRVCGRWYLTTLGRKAVL